MALSVQNKNFLSLLNRLGIDIKQFPDKTFDGLFDNIPEDINYFFTWFIENITSDNVLTQSEQALYFQLENDQLLPLEEEVNNVLSSYSPSFQELMNLDINYINNMLPQDVEDLTKNHEELTRILTSMEKNHSQIKKKQNRFKEKVSARKKQIDNAMKEWHDANIVFGSKMDDLKIFLLEDPYFSVDINSFNTLLKIEDDIFNKFETCKLFENNLLNQSKLDSFAELEEDLACVEISVILSKGFLREKKAKLNFLKELLEKKSLQESLVDNSFIQSYLINNEDTKTKIMEDVKILENEIFEKVKVLSQYKIKTITDQYKLQIKDLNRSYLEQLETFKNHMTSNHKINFLLLHILFSYIASVEDCLGFKKQLYLKLSEYERNFSNDITNLELKNQRFKEVSIHQYQHPLILALKNVMDFEENPENNKEAFKNIHELLLKAENNRSFITHKFRNALQSSIKVFFEETLFGPTSQVLLVPAELIIKLQYCEECENDLDQMIKRLANKFLDTKALISKSNRKKSLSWIELLINPQTSSD